MDIQLGNGSDFFNEEETTLIFDLLAEAKTMAASQLRTCASSPDFLSQMELAFGEGVDVSQWQEAWLTGDVTFPEIEILSSLELGNAWGASARSTDKIYLAKELLENQPLGKFVAVLLEEYGHFVDDQVNLIDALGDEGQIFSLFVNQKELTTSTFNKLREENDQASIFLDNQLVNLEQSQSPPYSFQVIAQGTDDDESESDNSGWTIVNLTNNAATNASSYYPKIDGDYILWKNVDQETLLDELILFDGHSTQTLVSDVYIGTYDLFGDQVVWTQYTDQDPDYEVYFYDDNQTIRLTDNDLEDYEPLVSELGVVWHERDVEANTDAELYFFDGTTIQNLTDNDIDYNFGVQISDTQISGDWVVWSNRIFNEDYPVGEPGSIRPPADDYDIFLFDGNNVINLSEAYGTDTLPGTGDSIIWRDWNPQISDDKIYWASSGYDLDWRERVGTASYLFDGQSVTQLNEVEDIRAVSEAGIVWFGDSSGGDSGIAYFYNGDTVEPINDSGYVYNVKISENQLVLTYAPQGWGSDYGIYTYKNGELVELFYPNSGSYGFDPEISESNIVWWGYENSSSGIADVFFVSLNDPANDLDTEIPVISVDQNFYFPENQSAGFEIGTVAASDNEGVTSYAIAQGNEGGFFNINTNGVITLTEAGVNSAANDFETTPNTFRLGITASDAAVNTSDEVDVTVNLENDPNDDPDDANQDPIANNDAVSTEKNTILNGNLFADNGNGIDSDPDNDSLTVTEVNEETINLGETITLASGALLTLDEDGAFTYNPNGQFEELDDGDTDRDSFTYTVSDGNGNSDTATVTITINSPILSNTLMILTDNSPQVIPVSSGFFMDFAGTQDSTRTFNLEEGAGANNLDAGATINLTGTSSDFTYRRDGSTLQILDGNDNLTAEILASPDTTSAVNFDDGSTEVAVAGGEITFGGESFEDGEEIDGAITELTLQETDAGISELSANLINEPFPSSLMMGGETDLETGNELNFI
ncbi:Cadherin [Halothece sp. PCC 7418]|uniref:Ig-like domain-containing protein n=1 Tax=Halothece sp. (strain PCC 7418) TaxID=65093 RepID=UPI0002A07412|nr:Ig-like domain-containing protein [Halothece sp. PCC 7418]AFZ42603.1 Cadherin [Halothece sp. PCC 7418]